MKFYINTILIIYMLHIFNILRYENRPTVKEILEEPLTYNPSWATSIKYFEKGESAKMVYDITKKARVEGTGFDITTQVFTAKGKVLWLRIIDKTEKKGGKYFRLYGSLQDITNRKKGEDKLKLALEENKDIKVALNQSAILAYTNEKGVITYANDKFAKISKYSIEELIGADHRILNSGHHSKEFMKDFWTTIKSGKIWTGEIKNKAKDGSFYWLQATVVPSVRKRGEITKFIAIRYDITDRKKAEESIKKHQKELERKNMKLEKIAWSFSHEVRAPVATIMGLSSIFNYKDHSDQINKEVMTKIQRPISSLNELVSNIVNDINDIN
ncbi:MAG: PAS domain S-box protein [Cyclobacteriaceae bacterium]|nr:PAS domain S-box protein [Cyclobacteriaceae bacterium]